MLARTRVTAPVESPVTNGTCNLIETTISAGTCVHGNVQEGVRVADVQANRAVQPAGSMTSRTGVFQRNARAVYLYLYNSRCYCVPSRASVHLQSLDSLASQACPWDFPRFYAEALSQHQGVIGSCNATNALLHVPIAAGSPSTSVSVTVRLPQMQIQRAVRPKWRISRMIPYKHSNPLFETSSASVCENCCPAIVTMSVD